MSVWVLFILVIAACSAGGCERKPEPAAQASGSAADPTPSLADVQAFGEERKRLIEKGALEDAERICKSWIERSNAVARAEGHKCAANVLVSRAQDSGDPVVVSGAAQRLSVGGTAAEPRFSGPSIARAIEQLDRAAELNPADLSTHQGRLFLVLGAGDYARAAQSLEDSLKRLPGAPVETWLTYLQGFPRARSTEAAAFARAIVARYPSDATARVALGEWLDVTGNEQEAKQHLEQALALDPQNAMAHWRLGEVLEQFNNAEAARVHYEKSLGLAGPLADERRSEYERRAGH